MSKPKIDRRVARTRTLLHHALMSLIVEKGYEATTVEDICDRADIGRSTFYAHYTSKNELRRAGLDHMRRTIVEEHRAAVAKTSGPRCPLSFSLTLFEHARGHLGRYRALLETDGGGGALAVIRQTLCELVGEELSTARRRAPAAIPREVVIQHIAGAYMAVLVWWLDGGAKLPPKRVDSMFRRLALQGLDSIGMA